MTKVSVQLEGLPELMKVRELAEFLRIDKDTAYNLVRCGTIHSVRAGRKILIPRQAVEQWLSGE